MKTIALILLINFGLFAQKKSDWIPLFNGKDISGWDIKIAGHALNDNYKNTFVFEDGMMRIKYNEYKNFDDKYGHMYYKTPYSHYILNYQYRFTGNQTPGGATWNVRNSGVMFHSQSAASNSFEQDFPVSLEMQLLGGLGNGPRHTGNLCTPGTIVHMKGNLRQEHCIDSESKTYDGDRWVSAQLIVLGDSVVHQIIEGDTVLTYEKTQIGEGKAVFADWIKNGFNEKDANYWISQFGMPLKEGYIALQAESHAIDFKDVELLNLSGCKNPKAKNYKSYYVNADNSKCLY
jgi:hypothetical protein